MTAALADAAWRRLRTLRRRLRTLRRRLRTLRGRLRRPWLLERRRARLPLRRGRHLPRPIIPPWSASPRITEETLAARTLRRGWRGCRNRIDRAALRTTIPRQSPRTARRGIGHDDLDAAIPALHPIRLGPHGARLAVSSFIASAAPATARGHWRLRYLERKFAESERRGGSAAASPRPLAAQRLEIGGEAGQVLGHVAHVALEELLGAQVGRRVDRLRQAR